VTPLAAESHAVSELGGITPEPALFGFTMRLAELVQTIGETVIRHEEELADLRETIGEVGARLTLESELRATADETARNEILELERRLATVHASALRALNARYGPKGAA